MPGGGGGSSTDPWSGAVPYLTGDRGINKWGEEYDIQGVIPHLYQTYMDNRAGMTPEQQRLNDRYAQDLGFFYHDMYDDTPTDPNNVAENLFQDMSSGQFVPDMTRVGGTISPNEMQAAQNLFTPDAEKQSWVASTVNPDRVRQMEAANVGVVGRTDPARIMPMTQMQAAVNEGYTPSGQVQRFMEGGAYNNRFLDQMYDSASRRFSENFNENIMGGITDSAVAAGGMGGSRQGIAEGIAKRGAANALSDMAGNMYGNAYNLGFGAMSDLTSQMMAGDISRSAQNAQLAQQANQLNAGWDNQARMQSMANQQAANMQDARLGLQGQLAQAGYDQQAAAANAGYGNQAIFSNQDFRNQAAAQNAAAANQFALANQGLGFNAATQNTQNLQDANQINAANNLQAQLANAGFIIDDDARAMQFGQTDLQNRLGAFGALTAGTQQQDALYAQLMKQLGLEDDMQFAHIGQYADLLYPAAGFGGSAVNMPGGNPYASAAGGALAGAAAGASLGTAVPVIGNVVGAAGGAIIGGLGGYYAGR